MVGENYLYIIECVGTEWVKVGISKDPFGRIKGLQTGCPYVLSLLYCQRVSDAEALEAKLHSEMEGYRSPAGNEFFHRDCETVVRILGSFRPEVPASCVSRASYDALVSENDRLRELVVGWGGGREALSSAGLVPF